MKLPLERVPYSGATDSWIKDADGKDIARCSCGRCSKCGGFGCKGNVAFPDKVAEAIVVDSRPAPAPGAGYWYLVRADNGCLGSYGSSTAGIERQPPACP